MSGGVDSSVAAALLLEQGYEVTGVFMKFWKPGQIGFGQFSLGENTCCSRESYQAAKKVARRLGIKLQTFNFEDDFKAAVVDDFLSLSRFGVTPNPCIVCNQKIKFGLFLEKARELGADFIATGHYARIGNRSGRYFLERARDLAKDQSYFLYRLTAEQLPFILFPVGEYTKPQVRKLAQKFDLPTATRADSQEVCFIPDNNLTGFLQKFIPVAMKPGPIVTTDGREIGQHQGLPAYTVGQRKGIGVGGIGPFYVKEKNISDNRLVVTKSEPELLSDKLTLLDWHWLDGLLPKKDIDCRVKIRYLANPVAATIKPDGRSLRVVFKEPQRAVTPGQAAVFYEGSRVLAGGTIK
jgi:tRNA-uridine 2-sulfurtransferase